MKIILNLFIIIIYGFVISCKVGNQASRSTMREKNTKTDASQTINTPDPHLSLVDYLRKVPGVQISGPNNDPTIFVRNAFSLYDNNRPLFVIDNKPVGNDYPTVASLVDVNDIKSITVLKDAASTSAYGMQGANGVIVITTKKGP